MSQDEITKLFFEIKYQLNFLLLSTYSHSTPSLINGRQTIEDFWVYPNYTLRVNYSEYREIDPTSWWKIEFIILTFNGQVFEQRWNGEF